jgi:sugar lactone lactonase YvrE
VRDGRRVWTVVLALALAALAGGCGGGATHVGSAETTANTIPGPASSSAPSANVPNPFTIVARYSAASLRLRNPRYLAIGPEGNLYITDASDRVAVVSPAGRVLRTWGKRGKGPGELHFVSTDPSDPNAVLAGIAVGPDGKVYVSDSGNQRIDVFSPTGAFVRQFGGSGTGNGRFLVVVDLAVDRTGNVYVADDLQMTLSKFSPTGHFEWSIGGGLADPDLRGHFHLANVDSHGRVVAAVDEARRIVYIDARGHKLDVFDPSLALREGPCNVTVDPAGNTVVQSCPPRANTLVFDRTHRLVGAWYDSPFGTDATPRFGRNGEAFAIGEDGTILKLKEALPGA